MSNPRHIADLYIHSWNETDPERRRTLLKENWTPDARYIDPLSEAIGADKLNDLIAETQTRFPGFRFALKGAPDGYGDHTRLSWTLGPDGVEAPIEGSDVVVTSNGRIARVIGFLDKVPQAA